MTRSWWSVALAGLGLGSLAMVGGTVVGGDVGPLAIGYGVLVALAALYMLAGLAVRDRVWRRVPHATHTSSVRSIDRLAGPRVF